jgi:uncharacterized protein (TIGR03435 family)
MIDSEKAKNTTPGLAGNDTAQDQQTSVPHFGLSVSRGDVGAVGHIVATKEPISALTRFISSELHAPVVDQTGLVGKYDFSMEFAITSGGAVMIASPPPTRETVPATVGGVADMRVALQEQLGLKLESTKTAMEMLLITHVNKIPSAN